MQSKRHDCLLCREVWPKFGSCGCKIYIFLAVWGTRGHCFCLFHKNVWVLSPDDDPGPRPTQRSDPEHRGPPAGAQPFPPGPGSADAEGHLHGHHELPQRVPADPAPAADGPTHELFGRSVNDKRNRFYSTEVEVKSKLDYLFVKSLLFVIMIF